eukprot:TRINITY_DN14620_c0_g1_i1.p1 TRINITY_DN14620_c0_g1~~TRINITY_DN14620_c0_g1_i1.p1  ORF type:complete len:438 (+),score=72.06 TRINITY_DN14620_c0_g1_i1:25-1314(+)
MAQPLNHKPSCLPLSSQQFANHGLQSMSLRTKPYMRGVRRRIRHSLQILAVLTVAGLCLCLRWHRITGSAVCFTMNFAGLLGVLRTSFATARKHYTADPLLQVPRGLGRDGFDPYDNEQINFGQGADPDYEQDDDLFNDTNQEQYQTLDDNAIAAQLGFNPFEVLDISPMDTIDAAFLRKAFRKQAKIYHPDVPRTGNAEKFQLIRRAVEELAALERLAAFKTMNPDKKKDLRPARQKNVVDDFWELRARDFFLELEMELTDELRGLKSKLTKRQKIGRMEVSKSYWEDFQANKVSEDEKLLEWMKKKREQRRTMVRQRLRGICPIPKQAKEAALTSTGGTMSKLRELLATWLGTPTSMLTPDMELRELGFFDNSAWNDVAKCLMALEDGFEKDNLIDMSERSDSRSRLLLPEWVKTVNDFADFIQGRL